MMTRTTWATLTLSAIVLGLTPATEADHGDRFWFSGPEIFPIDPRIVLLRVADLDRDGLEDIVVANNFRSKINLLYNQTDQELEPDTIIEAEGREINELPSDARFRIESIASEKRISSLIVEDLNGDDRPDILYYGDPKELLLLYNEGGEVWSSPKRWPIKDGSLSPDALATGDINGDGQKDIVLLAEDYFYLFLKLDEGAFGPAQKIFNSRKIGSYQMLDLNADRQDDLLLFRGGDRHPISVRFQSSQGSIGPEIFLDASPVRAFLGADLDGSGVAELTTIAQNSGRATVSILESRIGDSWPGSIVDGQFSLLSLRKTGKARRGILWVDVNQDGRTDLLTAEPEVGFLTARLQLEGGVMGPAQSYPSLTGIGEIHSGDWDGDGNGELFLLSLEERQVGVTRWSDAGRIPFPEFLPFDGRPLAMTVGALRPDENPRLSVVLERDGARFLRVIRWDRSYSETKLAASFKSNPSSLTLHDVDQDGLNDLIVLIPYEKLKVLRQVDADSFEEIDISAPGGDLDQPWLSRADIDGDGRQEVLLAQKNFVRAVLLKQEAVTGELDRGAVWSFQIKEQINGSAGNSRIVGACGFKLEGRQYPALFLIDAETKSLTCCQRDPSGTWNVVAESPLPFAGFSAVQPLAMGASRAGSLAFRGLNHVGWKSLSGTVWGLKELDAYETPIRRGRLNDVVSGDLNNDGRQELIFFETARHYLDVVAFEAPHQLSPATRWQVFEERTFRNQRSAYLEPREAQVADLTGDGKNDLAIIVHDRVLLYPQE